MTRSPLVTESFNTQKSLPPSEEVRTFFVWHQGGLGDLLLAGPALMALRQWYPNARLLVSGHPERWRLLARTLNPEAVWNSGEARWSSLYLEDVPLAPSLGDLLAGVDLGLVFSPRPRPVFLRRLAAAGVSRVFWLPSFPSGETEHVQRLQARSLAALGLRDTFPVFRLNLEGISQANEEDPPGPVLAVAPGSGHPAKNWPLAHYYEVVRTLAWEAKLKVIWLAGPAEEKMLPYLKGLAAAQEQLVWVNQPLVRVARLLARTELYLGGDSGLTHLAAAAGARRVVALYGPTDPRVWAPLGESVTVLTPPEGTGPGVSLANLSVGKVLAVVRQLLT